MQQRWPEEEGLLVVMMKSQRRLRDQQRWAKGRRLTCYDGEGSDTLARSATLVEEEGLLVVMVKVQRRLHESETLGRGRGAVSCRQGRVRVCWCSASE